jgi:hypothetical protein
VREGFAASVRGRVRKKGTSLASRQTVVSRIESRTAIAEGYAAEAAEAEHLGQHRRAAKLYKMALLTLLGGQGATPEALLTLLDGRGATPEAFVQNRYTEADLPDSDAHLYRPSAEMHPDASGERARS